MSDEPTRAEIKEVVDVLKEEVDRNPSNAELLQTIEKGAKVFRDHAEEDKVNFDAIHARMDALATSKELDEKFSRITDFISDVDLTFKVIRGTGKYGKTILLTVASIFIAITIITGGIKSVIGFVATWALNK